MIGDFMTTDIFRRRMADVARAVVSSGQTVAIGTTVGRPRYILRPAMKSPDGEPCVRLGPDELRRNFTEIRALVRLDDIRFGIIVDGECLAVLARHPEYRAAAAEQYREVYGAQRGGGISAAVQSRMTVMEMALKTLADRLAALERQRS
jgi:hypothetical protein